MKKIILCLFLILGFAVVSEAQTYTTVTATVTSPNGVAYAYGSYGVTLVNTSGQQPLLGGNANFQQTFSGQAMTVTGALSIVLPSVTAMTPSSGLQWQFNICANPQSIVAVFPAIALPCFSYTTTGTTISGSSVNISSQLNGVAATIPSTATVNSVGAALNVKASPYNALGNGKKFTDGVTNAGNNQLTSATAAFAASDVNQTIWCVS